MLRRLRRERRKDGTRQKNDSCGIGYRLGGVLTLPGVSRSQSLARGISRSKLLGNPGPARSHAVRNETLSATTHGRTLVVQLRHIVTTFVDNAPRQVFSVGDLNAGS